MPQLPISTVLPITVIYENEKFLAVDKPSGVLVHPYRLGKKSAKRGIVGFHTPTLADWIRDRYPDIGKVGDDPAMRPGIVHRLDKETSGVLLIAKTQDYFLYLKHLFQTRDVTKRYCALVSGVVDPAEGVVDKAIGIVNGTVRRSVFSEKMAKPAVTRYRLSRVIGDYSLVDVFPETGRTHQIRVHLASIGHPVCGDRLYGKRGPASRFSRLMLHAREIEFSPRPGERLVVSAPLPPDFMDNVRRAES
jgi:23S rRNA pseudouridine1911/1915/1917 synthase